MPLPDDSIEKWTYNEHTKVKHLILSKYLEGWIKIVGKFHDLNIYDCFAGRGKYMNGSNGSPLIILEKLASIRKKMGRPNEACCIFIEKNENNFQNLYDIIENERKTKRHRYGDWLDIEYHNDEFANVSEKIMEDYGKELAPSFFFIDPFGFSGLPLKVIKNLLTIERTEVFITFMIRDVNRFLKSSPHRISIEELFNMDNVPETLSTNYSSLPKEQALLKLYRKRLHEYTGVKFTLPFKVNADERLQTIYYLLHCTNHPKGCEIMKEIMFKTGTEGRFGYLGPAEGQMSLNQFHSENDLIEYLLNRFKGRTLSFQEIRYELLMEIPAIRKQYLKAIKNLSSLDKIRIRGKGPRGGIPDTALISF